MQLVETDVREIIGDEAVEKVVGENRLRVSHLSRSFESIIWAT